MRSEKGQLIFNASLTLTFSDSSLTGVSGTFLPALDEGRRTDGLDAVDALVHFLDYCSVSGVVCTEVRALDEGYLPRRCGCKACGASPRMSAVIM